MCSILDPGRNSDGCNNETIRAIGEGTGYEGETAIDGWSQISRVGRSGDV